MLIIISSTYPDHSRSVGWLDGWWHFQISSCWCLLVHWGRGWFCGDIVGVVADKQLDGGLSWVRWAVCYWVFLRYVLSWENNFSVFSVSVKSPLDLIPDQRWLLLEVWKCSLLSSNLLSQNAQTKNYFFFIFLALWGALGDSVYTVCSSADLRRGEKKDGQNHNLQDEMGLTCVLRCWCPQHGTQW